MIKDLLRIADFLDKNGYMKDANLIDYISEKYADGDLKAFFKRGMTKDFLYSEYGNRKTRGLNKRASISEEISEEEAAETEELLKSLMKSLEE